MNSFEKAYLDVIFESDYSDDYWMKNGSYRGIDFYVRKDGHLRERLAERYKNISVSNAIQIMKRFIKLSLNDETSFLSKRPSTSNSISFTIHGIVSNVYVSGRFKANGGVWRCYIATALPSEGAHHSSNDYFKEINA